MCLTKKCDFCLEILPMDAITIHDITFVYFSISAYLVHCEHVVVTILKCVPGHQRRKGTKALLLTHSGWQAVGVCKDPALSLHPSLVGVETCFPPFLCLASRQVGWTSDSCLISVLENADPRWWLHLTMGVEGRQQLPCIVPFLTAAVQGRGVKKAGEASCHNAGTKGWVVAFYCTSEPRNPN